MLILNWLQIVQKCRWRVGKYTDLGPGSYVYGIIKSRVAV
ncbi:MAG: hypothetical protein K0S61_1919 [Anaerocolumna sp.]|jgi:hypothetical protein|nr:hypothetical protein [Anaerocolumna sp.]